MSSSLVPPFRADVVGSYLRPAYLHQARSEFSQGRISREALTEVEDRAIRELVEQEKQAGLQVITDGEFRRSWWHLDFMWGLNGVEKVAIDEGYHFAAMKTRPESARLVGRISGENHPFLEHFRFLQSLADDSVCPRQTVPAPAQFMRELLRAVNIDSTRSIYPDEDELIADIAAAYRTFIREIHALGCRSLQFDDCTWGMLTDPKLAQAAIEAETGCSCCGPDGSFDHVGSIAALKEKLLRVNNESMQGAPEDLVLTTHVCRGNYRSTWSASGGYEPVADVLLSRENVSAFYLEFDSDRAGDFAPLRHLGEGKKVVLGLVSSKVPELEDAEVIEARVREASQYVPLENLCLSTQCGFASTEEGNALTPEQQWAKIALVRKVAEKVWG